MPGVTLLCVSHPRDDPTAATVNEDSQFMESALHVIAGPGPGQLATCAHPRGEDWPLDYLTALAGHGVNVLVSALTAPEQQRLGFAGTILSCATLGVEFIPFPVTDGGPPRDEAAKVIHLASALAAHVRAGRFVVTQCFGGIGRSTLLAGMTLVLLGIPPGDALRRVAGASEMPVTRDWLHEFAAAHAPAASPQA
jgi:protein-tyrosine phosphatase